ncbi:Potassium voltage-gated channel subfamily D member 1, partial [Ophiophagus hannah]
MLVHASDIPSAFIFFLHQDRDPDAHALAVRNRSAFEQQHHHLLHCLEKTTSHEFTDEHSYSDFCLTEPLGYRTSRSTSLSSQQGSKGVLSTSCCPRRNRRRTTRLTNSTMSVSRASAQELDMLNSQKSAAPQSRSNLNAKTHDNLKLNCDTTDFTAAIICIPTPPANTPDDSHPPSPRGPGGPVHNSSLSPPYLLHETVKISSL